MGLGDHVGCASCAIGDRADLAPNGHQEGTVHWQQRGTEYWIEGDRWPMGRWGVWRAPVAEGNLRASDAERAHVADLLSQHFGEGRLDAAEFDERLNRAMKAKVRNELTGLLDDLPPLQPDQPEPPHRGRWRAVPLMVALWVLAVAAVASIATSIHFWFLVLAIAVLFLWRRSHWHGYHHHHHSMSDTGGPRS
jgi:hypothetical protein